MSFGRKSKRHSTSARKGLVRLQKVRKVMKRKGKIHEFWSTAYNPQRRQHFMARQKTSSSAAIQYCETVLSGRPKRPRLKSKNGKSWRSTEEICRAACQALASVSAKWLIHVYLFPAGRTVDTHLSIHSTNLSMH